ncbi:MAG: S41 family peptidase [Deltaproteobacteria bacterium]|nr:S41 family peptidase [Deltaproteobacteria bacterium]
MGVSLGLVKSRGVGAVTDGIYENLKVFTDVLSIIQKDYVDVEKTDSQALVYGAINGMLATLDPHSSFMPPDVFKEAQLDTKGKFEGLGIEIEMRDGVLTVVAPIEGTPAWNAGIKPGDKILKIDGEPTKKMSLLETVHKLRGPKGTRVTIAIMREGFDKPRDFTIERGVIPIRSVRSEILDGGYGYIRIRQFSERTDREFRQALRKWEKSIQGPPKGLILDLRDNPGGLLDQAVKVADHFIESGVIVSIRGRHPSSRSTYGAHAKRTEKNYPVVVLVSDGSASGSEIVAGALQDYHKAVIVGTRTFGKATVQTLYPLRDGSGLRLTTGRYFTPNGRDIQAEGIEPDVFLPPFGAKERAGEKGETKPQHFLEKDLEGHLEPIGERKEKAAKRRENPELEEFIDRLKAEVKETETDGQKSVALRILRNWGTFQTYLHGSEEASGSPS